ncbi:hypothetical protein [Streptomyces tsukubensis]|uniref:Uncharacterized protein n=1 Tax=Streptomyces tsukubensis TaxID=83656 RepID=A0A1V4A360_9ACTN|nr:hypothetical protein [Streptomyces tsukubensis]OON74036.1 hypothetical protein B1H18_26375 [Streptomyces tsukubensis]QFR92915.1 hypothetical protein GBW32_07320 [Streptomyces tsukubensis]
MTARSHTRHPADTGTAETRLSWWSIALPSLAFAVLLLMILHPADAQAATTVPSVGHFLERVQHAWVNRAP